MKRIFKEERNKVAKKGEKLGIKATKVQPLGNDGTITDLGNENNNTIINDIT